MITFREKDLLGGRVINVCNGPVILGKIRRGGTAMGGYQYFPGSNNQLNWTLWDNKLNSLKEKIKQKDNSFRL